MRNYPVVSIIIPSLNSGKFIGDAIKSIIEQDYPYIDIIVVDGGSIDNTNEVLSKFDRIRIIKEEDSGQTEAINKGFKISKGDILFWLNADDLLVSENAVGSVVKLFKTHPEIGAVYMDYLILNHQGKVLMHRKEIDFDLNVLLFGPNFIGMSAFMRRAVYQGNGPLDDSLRYTMDLEYWLRLGVAGVKFGHIREPGIGFRYHHTSKSVAERPQMQAEDWMVRRKYTTQLFPSCIKWMRILYYFYRLKRQYLKLITLKTIDIPFRVAILRRLATKCK